MSQNSVYLRPFDEIEFTGSRRDLPTCYNIIGTYPKSKYLLGDPLTGNKERYDKPIVKPQYPNKNLSRGWPRIPHRGMQSEYGGSYKTHTYSDVFPYLHDNGVVFPLPIADGCGPWQIYATPAMYCTDYCHIGSDYPVRAVLKCASRKFYHKNENVDLSVCCEAI